MAQASGDTSTKWQFSPHARSGAFRLAKSYTVPERGPAWGRSGRTSSEGNAKLLPMATRPKLTPIQVLERLQHRLEKRMEALQRVKLDGFHMVISELATEM